MFIAIFFNEMAFRRKEIHAKNTGQVRQGFLYVIKHIKSTFSYKYENF